MFYLHYAAYLLLLALLGPAIMLGCQSGKISKGIPSTIIVGEAAIHQEPNSLSPKLATLTFGQEVMAFPKKSPKLLGDWTEVGLDKHRSGFVKDSALGTTTILETFQQLNQSIEGIEPQASGMTTAPTYFRLEPGRQGKPIEKLPRGTRFEMFQRQATVLAGPNGTLDIGPPKKEIWYKVRLADSRVGFIFTRNFKLEPPSEISVYTQSRKPMAWLQLRTGKGEESASGSDYIAAYATPNSDFGADFDRIEVYSWDGQRYQTVFHTKGLRGILPIRVIRVKEDIYFEITEINPNRKAQVVVSRYLYDYPYKIVGSSTVEQDVGLH